MNLANVDMRSVVLMRNVKRHTLPLVQVAWLDERPRDRCGRRRSSVTMPGSKRATPPANKGKTYPASPLTVAEMLRLLEQCNQGAPFGRRDYALILLMWRTGLRVNCEALKLLPHDVDLDRGVVHVQSGKNSKARFVGLDPGACERLRPWMLERVANYPAGPLFPVVEGPTRGGHLGAAYLRKKLKEYATAAGITKRCAPHQLRHTLACELANEMPVHLIQRQLGHSSLATTATYLSGIAPVEVLTAVRGRSFPGDVPDDTPESRTTEACDGPTNNNAQEGTK